MAIALPSSPRLNYRLLDETDGDFLWELDQDEEVMRFLNGGRKTSRKEINDIFIPRLLSYRNAPAGWGLWQVSLNDTSNSAIGWILVRPKGFFSSQRDDSVIELGWRFKREAWGLGYATEAAQAIMKLMQSLGSTAFCAIALPQNMASIQIMKKLGMTYRYSELYQDSVWCENVVVYQTA
ncbi:GNAT family N-acetyltransferase [Alteromonas sp. AMM-1]|uniref:GNAT family N-acetyltransferase n=1 Tax=Alteromonas sp. AMM-1 TaxID=3394233 RepID=UPI0039A76CFB